MRTIELHGRLGRIFGDSFKLDVQSPLEAIQALVSQLPGFEDELRAGQYHVVRRSDDYETDTSYDQLALGLGKCHTLQIIPVAVGAKSQFFQVLLGGVLIGAAFLLTGGTLSATAFTLLGSSITGSQIAMVGGLLALSGVAAMLAPEVAQAPEPEKERDSFMISTPSNRVEQGNAVAWVFGSDVFVGSVVISNGVAVEDIG
jgi:predicted phage tail protein